MKSRLFTAMGFLQRCTQLIAFLFNIALVMASAYKVSTVFSELFAQNITSAIQEGLSVMILLEMFYVVRSFIKYGSINTSLIISVGIVAIVKEIIVNLRSLDLNNGLALSVMFLSLSIGLLIEHTHYVKKINDGRKPRSLPRNTWLDFFNELEERQASEKERISSATHTPQG